MYYRSYPYYYYLCHGGPGSGRYEAGSGERPWQHVNRGNRIKRRQERKLTRIDVKAAKKQAQADKRFAKYERKTMSMFSTERGIEKAKIRAMSSQRKVNRLEVKGSRYFQRTQKKLAKYGIESNPEMVSLGEEFMKRAREKSRSMYLGIMAAA